MSPTKKPPIAQPAKALNEKLDSPHVAGEFEALLLKSRLRDLVKSCAGKGNEQAHEIFLEFCELGASALKPHKNKPSKSPAADLLLLYLLLAMQSYAEAVRPSTAPSALPFEAADRREALARAFMLTGKPPTGVPDAKQIEACHAFSSTILEQTETTGWPPNKAQLTAARRAAYFAHWGEEWQKDDEKSKARMKSTKRLLEDQGLHPI